MLFRYFVARLRHPGDSSKRFIRAGLGLERRSRALAVFWSEHLSRSRAAQTRWSLTCKGDILTVLGAGPLRDFNAIALGRRFKRFRMVDANPLWTSSWARLGIPVEPVVTDISCCLGSWSQAIRHFKGPWDETLVFIRALGHSPVPAYSPGTDGLLSLNILSQLDVGWQEMVESVLSHRFGRGFVRQREQEWLAAIQPGSQTLVEQHLASLEASRAAALLLITDVEYVEYTGRKYSSRHYESPPLAWSGGGWQAEPGIRFEVIPALEGIPLDSGTFVRWLPSYRLEWQDTWLWHIAPHGTETTGRGKLHRVAAFSLRRLL